MVKEDKKGTPFKEKKSGEKGAGKKERGFWRQKSTFQLIFLALAMILIIMPFITTFNEFLTKIVERFHFYTILEDSVVPYLSRLVAVVLRPWGYTIAGTYLGLFIMEKNLSVQIAWNCIGWQSMILIAITLVTGLQGHYSRFSKGQTVLIGLLGTFLLNVFRIASVVLVAIYFGHFPAVIYHDYFSNLLIVLWLFLFWWFAYAYVLVPVSGGMSAEKIVKTEKGKKRFSFSLPWKVIKEEKKANNSFKKKNKSGNKR